MKKQLKHFLFATVALATVVPFVLLTGISAWWWIAVVVGIVFWVEVFLLLKVI